VTKTGPKRGATARRDRHRKLAARGHPPCHICGEPIDYNAGHLEPLSFQIDHVIPLEKGGPDEMFLPDGTPQILPSHRKCNREKGAGPREVRLAVAFVTERNW